MTYIITLLVFFGLLCLVLKGFLETFTEFNNWIQKRDQLGMGPKTPFSPLEALTRKLPRPFEDIHGDIVKARQWNRPY